MFVCARKKEKMKNGTLRKIILFWMAGLVCMSAFAGKIDSSLVGNWIDPATGAWMYGFYENFAVYDGAFWTYKQVKPGKKQTVVNLENGRRQLRLVWSEAGDGSLRLKGEKKKVQILRKYDGAFVPYPGADTVTFAPPAFRTDTVVLTGYIRDRASGPEPVGKEAFVRAILVDAIAREFVIDAPVDSCGRFSLSFPLFAPAEVSLFDGRPVGDFIFFPGERTFVYIGEKAPAEETAVRGDTAAAAHRTVLFMGGHARLRNEGLAVPVFPLLPAGTLAVQAGTDSSFLALARKDYEEKRGNAERFMARYPTLSARTVQAVGNRYLYEHGLVLASYLAGRTGRPDGPADPVLSGYLAKTFPVAGPSDLFLTREYAAFAREYVDYLEAVSPSPEQDMAWLMGWWQKMVQLGAAPEGERSLLEPLVWMNDPEFRKQAEADTAIQRKVEVAAKRMEKKVPEYLKSMEGQTVAQLHLLDGGLLAHAGQALPDPVLQEWLLTRLLMEKQSREQMPFPAVTLRFFDDRVHTPAFRECLYAFDAALREKTAGVPFYPGSLCDAAPLAGSADPETLLARLLEPYRGKVVYLDVWGAWCGPCRVQMARAREIENAYRGKDVAFVCLANNTAEADWKEAVRSWGISGENIFHYCLPDKQQEMLERYLGIRSFPTYLLFDKEGRLKNRKAPTPLESDRLLPEIDALLAE